jgi:hypothetical protein
LSMVLSMIPPGETTNKGVFELKLLGGTGIALLVGLALYWRSKSTRRDKQNKT